MPKLTLYPWQLLRSPQLLYLSLSCWVYRKPLPNRFFSSFCKLFLITIIFMGLLNSKMSSCQKILNTQILTSAVVRLVFMELVLITSMDIYAAACRDIQVFYVKLVSASSSFFTKYFLSFLRTS